jgi:hypothetical protein
MAVAAPLLVLLLAAADVPAEAAALLARGDAEMAARGDPDRLAAALAAYESARALLPGRPDVELRLARAECFRAQAAPEAARAAWLRCSAAAERALRTLAPPFARAVDAGADPVPAIRAVGPAGAEPLYWMALATWSAAQAKGFAAVLAVKDVALAAMERAAALDGTLDCGGPHRALGAWRAGLPVAVGGGAERSRAHFEAARAAGPECQLNRVAEAETLRVLLQDRAGFDKLLSEVAASRDADAPRWAPENEVARRRARELRDRAARLF